jgi:hypothetical protein
MKLLKIDDRQAAEVGYDYRLKTLPADGKLSGTAIGVKYRVEALVSLFDLCRRIERCCRFQGKEVQRWDRKDCGRY